jgi:circadian clock protein KaiB
MPRNDPPPRWVLTLYVSGASPHSADAIDSIRRLCATELDGQVELQVVDVREQPALAVADHVLAVPTLVKRLPEPLRRLVGDLGDDGRLRLGLDLGPAPPATLVP